MQYSVARRFCGAWLEYQQITWLAIQNGADFLQRFKTHTFDFALLEQ